MRILSHNAGLITNFEVSRVLEVQKARGKAGKRGTKDMVFVEKQVGHYLYHHSLARRQTEESVAAFIAASEAFDLTVAEQLQIINLCPTTLVEVYLSIDEAEHRLNGEERVHELLNMIMNTLYVPEDQVPAAPLDDRALGTEVKAKNRNGSGGRGGRGGKRTGRGGGRGGHKSGGGRGRGAPRDRK